MLGLPVNGLKLELLYRLKAALSADTASSASLAAALIAAESGARGGGAGLATDVAVAEEPRVGRRGVQPGTAVVGKVTSAKVSTPNMLVWLVSRLWHTCTIGGLDGYQRCHHCGIFLCDTLPQLGCDFSVWN